MAGRLPTGQSLAAGGAPRAGEAGRAGDEGAGDELSGVSVRIIAEQACSEAIL
ncbi:MAG: hypothetical protein ACYDHX_09690 [Methanothrix sp.]